MIARLCTANRTTARGFTLVEALVATTITAVAGSALLLGLSTALNNTNLAVEQSVAAGMAQQIMDEVAGKIYCSDPANLREWPMGPSSSEKLQPGRQYNDLDDYNGFAAQPAVDPLGVKLGTENGAGSTRHPKLQATNFFDRWRQEVSVYYVSPTSPSTRLPNGQTSYCRAVEVRILIDEPTGLRELHKLRRVFAHVPTSEG